MEILDTPESFEIKVPIRKYWIPMFWYGGLTIMIGLNVILVLYEEILDDGFYFLPFPFAFGLVLILLVFFNLTMWFNFGFEKLIFTNNRLEIIKSNRIFSIKKTINICDVKVVKTQEKSQDEIDAIEGVLRMSELIRTTYFWWKMGQLTLEVKNSKRTILNGLKENEIAEMKTLIEKEIEQRCS